MQSLVLEKTQPLIREFKRGPLRAFITGDCRADAHFYATYESILYAFNEPDTMSHLVAAGRFSCNAAYSFVALVPHFATIDFSIVLYNKSRINPREQPNKLMKWHLKCEGKTRLALEYFQANFSLWTNQPISILLNNA